MKALSEDLRLRIVDFYQSHPKASYINTAEHFSVGAASVSRLLRLKRETGDIRVPNRQKKSRLKVNLDWLNEHAKVNPNARLKDRVADYEAATGVTVAISSMWAAIIALGWTHKKRRSLPQSESRIVSRHLEKSS